MAENKKTKEHFSVLQLKTPQDHYKKIKELIQARWEHEREWKLNHAFYIGNQYAFFPKRSTNMVTLETEPAELPRYRVRLVSNQIMPGVRSLVSKLTKTKPVIHAVPSVATEKASRGAQVAERLTEHWWRELDLTAKRNEAWTWAQIAGQGWWKIGWNFNAGKTITYTLGPDGLPILSDKLADLFSEQLQSQGIEPIEAVVALGEVSVDVISPFDVILDPSPSHYTECQFAYCQHRLTPDEVYNRYKVWITPDSRGSTEQNNMFIPGSRYKDDEMERDLVTVYVGYFKKSNVLPKGRYVIFTPNHDKFLYYGEWPYPFDDLPLVKFPGIQIPGCIYDRGVVSDARPLQQEFNRSISQVIEYKNLNIAPQFTAPANSMMRNRITGEPGVIWYYNQTNASGSGKPEPIQLGALPPYIFDNLSFTLSQIKDIFQITEVSEGGLPPNLEAGVAIDLLQEISIDQLEPQIQQGEMALAKAGTLMLSFAQTYYDEPRLTKMQGGNQSQAKTFTKTDIKDVDIYVEAGSGIPRTRAGRQLRIKNMIDTGLIRPDQAWKYYDMADLKTLQKRFAQDEEKASRENDLLLRGVPLNIVAMQSAAQAMSTGVNPMTQMPLQPGEAEVIIQDAGLEPGPADNHLVEMDIHAITIKSEEFNTYPPEIQQAHFSHYGKHAAFAGDLGEKQPPKISYTIRGTAGPTATTEILKTGGINVTPEMMAEPPLETWVSDSVDKIDQDEAGNDPLSQLDIALMAGKVQEQMARTDLMKKRAAAASKTTTK